MTTETLIQGEFKSAAAEGKRVSGDGEERRAHEGREGVEGKRYNWHHQSVNKDLIMSEMRWLSNRLATRNATLRNIPERASETASLLPAERRPAQRCSTSEDTKAQPHFTHGGH